MGLRMLTVAWMQKEYLLSSVPQNWTHFFNSGKLNSYLWVQKTELIFLSPEKLKSPAWNTWQKKLGKIAQSMFRTRVDTFGNDFGLFWNFEFFLENLPRLDHPWNTEQSFLSKKYPKTRLDTWERFWTILEFWIFFHFFLEIFLSLYLKI